MWNRRRQVLALHKRLLLLPLVWLVFGTGEVLSLKYLSGGIASIAPTSPNDKPIGGSVLPVLFFNVAVLLGVIAISLYSLGVWHIDLTERKTRTDLIALGVLISSGFLLWYNPVALFAMLASLVYFLAVSVE